MSRRSSHLLALGAIGAFACATTISASAQDREGRPGAGRPPASGPQRPFDGGPDRPNRRGEAGPLGAGPLGAIAPIRPQPKDFAPLQPGEGDSLLKFAREKVPSIYRRLDAARGRNPGVFRQKLKEAAPRLRQLQRMFNERPRLAARFVQHVENIDAIGRAARAYVKNTANPNGRQRAENEIRRRVAENLTIEVELLRDHVRELDDRRDALANDEFDRLTAEGTDLSPEPPLLRETVKRIHDAPNDESRQRGSDDLRRMIDRRLNGEIERCRNRAAMLNENRPREVDIRTTRVLENAEQKRPLAVDGKRPADSPADDDPPPDDDREGKPSQPRDRP